LKKCETIHAQTRTTNASISFIERTYRKKDPNYADFTIRTQQQLLARLNEEWTKSECKEPSPAPEQIVLSSAHREDSIKTRRESIKAADKKASLSLPSRISKEVQLQLKKCERISAEIRATKDSIAFIEKTYRKKDPDYADFTIQTQQQLLENLNEEWAGSECK
jgi:hypothetical protein